MTPKEKALELVTKYAAFNITTLGCGYEKGNPCIITNVMFKDSAKQCALIAVDEVLHYSKAHGFIGLTDHLEQVKTEIEKL